MPGSRLGCCSGRPLGRPGDGLKPVAYMPSSVLLVVVVFATALSAQQPPAALPQGSRGGCDPTWKWSDERIAEFWSEVSAGPSLKPASWPDRATVAVALSFDFQMGTVYEPRPTASTNTNSQYDGRVGLPRILKLLDKYTVPASFFVTGVTAKFYPEVIKQIIASGQHEIGVHGWIHENNVSVPPDEERRLVMKAIESLQAVTGKRPVGYRSPSWAFSGATLGILRDLNFLYDSGMMADDEPYEIFMNGKPTGLLEIPVEWVRDDAMYYPRQNPHNPDDVLETWKAEFHKAYEEHGLFQVTMHPRISGNRARTVMLEKLITHIRQHRGVWFATHEQVARYVREQKPSSTR
jgi:peptidoglycan/xylan/chitin deacetylase (PgdA/CDA1 family)